MDVSLCCDCANCSVRCSQEQLSRSVVQMALVAEVLLPSSGDACSKCSVSKMPDRFSGVGGLRAASAQVDMSCGSCAGAITCIGSSSGAAAPAMSVRGHQGSSDSRQ